MTETNRKKLNLGVKLLKNFLKFKEDQIIVTGSIALDLQGVIERDSHDVDFIIKMTEETYRCVKFLEQVYKDDNDSYYPNKDVVIFKVKEKDLVINIWMAKPEEIANLTLKDAETGVWVSPVKNILKAKRNYGRQKDYNDIINICKVVMG